MSDGKKDDKKIDPGSTREMRQIEKLAFLQEAMNMSFAFKVGDLVVPRAPLEAQQLSVELDNPSIVRPVVPDCIIQRFAQECPGGIQLNYEVRRRSPEPVNNGSLLTYTEIKICFLEHELVSWDEAIRKYHYMYNVRAGRQPLKSER